MSASCPKFLHFWELCTGLLALRIWGTWEVSFLEVSIIFEQWAGHRLLSERVTRPHVRANRPVSISSLPVKESKLGRVGDPGGSKKVRRTDIGVNLDLASLPGPHGFLNGPWVQVHGGGITGADVAA